MVLTLIVGSDFYCILPSQSPKGDSSPRGRAKGLEQTCNRAINCDFAIKRVEESLWIYSASLWAMASMADSARRTSSFVLQ